MAHCRVVLLALNAFQIVERSRGPPQKLKTQSVDQVSSDIVAGNIEQIAKSRGGMLLPWSPETSTQKPCMPLLSNSAVYISLYICVCLSVYRCVYLYIYIYVYFV